MELLRTVRYIIFSAEIILAYIIQTTPGLLPEIFGGKPVLLVPLALSIAVFEGELSAIAFGTFCGLLADFGYIGPVGYYGISLAVICWIISILTENYIRRNLLTAVIVGTVCIPLIIFIHFIFFYVVMGYDDAGGYFLRHYVSRIIYTWSNMFLFYWINGFLEKHTQPHEKHFYRRRK